MLYILDLSDHFTAIIWMTNHAYFIFHFMFLSVVGGIDLQVCNLITVAVAFILRGNILYIQIGKESAFF